MITKIVCQQGQTSVVECTDPKSCAQVDLMHMMSYDQPGEHSTWAFGKRAVDQGVAVLPAGKLTMGLPFYSRDIKTGAWDTYEDLVKIHMKGNVRHLTSKGTVPTQSASCTPCGPK